MAIRNYKAMRDPKLLNAIRELRGGPGYDAYERALNRHTGSPSYELAYAEREAIRRGLMGNQDQQAQYDGPFECSDCNKSQVFYKDDFICKDCREAQDA